MVLPPLKHEIQGKNATLIPSLSSLIVSRDLFTACADEQLMRRRRGVNYNAALQPCPRFRHLLPLLQLLPNL
jgi:hypothetical protein